MTRLLLLIITCSILSACASKQVHLASAPYCYTDETHVVQAGEETIVNSETILECTDRPGAQAAIQRAGIDVGCEEFWYTETRNGSRFPVRGVRCEKLDGSWEILDINGYVN